MAKRDYYEVLGVTKTSTTDEIKKAYRNLARKHHPDVDTSEGAHERFKEINEAYQVLSDDKKRQTYDQFGHSAFESGAGAGYGPGVHYYSYGGPDTNFDFGGFRDPFEIFEEFFGGASSFSGNRRRSSSTGEDLHYELTISFEDSVFGTERKVEIPRHVSCPACHGSGSKDGKKETCKNCQGSGQVRQNVQSIFGNIATMNVCPSCHGAGSTISNACQKCKGQGRLKETQSTEIKIPSGVIDGSQIRFKGLGEAGLRGSLAGDLFLIIRVLPHKFLKRQGFDLFSQEKIPMSSAVLGDTIEVKTVDGTAKLKVPSGTQPGTQFRLKGYGMTHPQGKARGDQYVTVDVEIPTKLTRHQEELLKEFSAEEKNGFWKF